MNRFRENVLSENSKITNDSNAFRVVLFDDGMLTFSRRGNMVILGVIYVDIDDYNIKRDITFEVVSQFCDIMKQYKIITSPIVDTEILIDNGFKDITGKDGVKLFMYDK